MSPIQTKILAGALFAAPAAFAQEPHEGPEHNQINGLRIDLHANVDPFGVFGAGARFEFAVAPNGFIAEVHDELALSLGADMMFLPVYYGSNGYGGAYLVPIAAVQWNFYVGDWSFFPEAGLAIRVGVTDDGWYGNSGHRGSWMSIGPDLGVGARYHFSARTALLMRVSTPGGMQVGIVF